MQTHIIIAIAITMMSAHAVLQAATILIVASVGEWRKELVQQIAVRAVELDGIYSKPRNALGRRPASARTRALSGK